MFGHPPFEFSHGGKRHTDCLNCCWLTYEDVCRNLSKCNVPQKVVLKSVLKKAPPRPKLCLSETFSTDVMLRPSFVILHGSHVPIFCLSLDPFRAREVDAESTSVEQNLACDM